MGLPCVESGRVLMRSLMVLVMLSVAAMPATAQPGCVAGECVEFVGGSLLANGSADAGGEFDSATAAFPYSRFSVVGSGLTSAGFGDDSAQGSVSMSVEIESVGGSVQVQIRGTGSAVARASGGGDFSSANLTIDTSDASFEEDPLIVLVQQPLRFRIESIINGGSVSLRDASGTLVSGDTLEPGEYSLRASLGAFASTDLGVDTDESSIDWTLTLDPILPCRVDLDGDGETTIFDFLVFLNLFDAGDLRADFDGDGELTIFDFLVFGNEFDAGCG